MSKKHVLIIDDQEGNVLALAAMLGVHDIDYTAVLSPKDLPTVLKRSSVIDAIFLDLEFPNHSGFSLFQELRSDSSLECVPIIAYSVHIDQMEHTKELGFDGFLGKPISAERFPGHLHRIFNGEEVWDIGDI